MEKNVQFIQIATLVLPKIIRLTVVQATDPLSEVYIIQIFQLVRQKWNEKRMSIENNQT